MKRSSTTQQQIPKTNRKTVENKDNIDSRKNEEQDFKGNDSTHNQKETKAKHLKQKK